MTTTTPPGEQGKELVAVPAASGDMPEKAAAATYADVTKAGELRPIVPPHWRKENRAATVRQHKKRIKHKALFHGLRLPAHGARMTRYAVRGAAVLAARIIAWQQAADLRTLESLAVAQGRSGHSDAMRAHTEGKKTRAARGQILAACIIAGAICALAMWVYARWWGFVGLAVLAYPALASAGKPAGRPMVERAAVAPALQKLTPDVVLRALGSTGIGAIDKAVRDKQQIDITIGRDGPGWRAEVNLPYGVTAGEVMERRDKLASGLRRDIGCVWPEQGTGSRAHAGTLIIYVCDEPLREARQPAWPLAKTGRADIFGPIPFGVDQRGRGIALTLMFANLLIGSIPRMGKTVAMRIVLLFAALDPFTELHVFELKGTGDLRPVEGCSHRYASGADDDTIAACAESVRYLAEVELVKRAKTISDIAARDRARCPENKVTPELSRDKRLGLHPVVLAIDECQEGFKHTEYGKQLALWCERLIKRGPALGIMLVLATQKPDKDSLPTSITSNVALRFCLLVMDQMTNDMILGTSSYQRGIRATTLTRADKGCGYLLGDDPAPQLTRTYYFQGERADAIGVRARAVRLAAGTLSGHALGQADETEARSFGADVLSVFGADGKLWCETIAARLAGQLADAYADITQEAVASQLRALGVEVKRVREPGREPRSGCERSAVEGVAGGVS